jgi:diaminohydroxyphosphoribosylaminopyrimidine deaminase/5-amino-6-(5-phosphoribosylamino)uracil reductase
MDEIWMQRALELAARGEGSVEPNPQVGCVIVRGDERLGEGYHAKYGEAHAERAALASVPDGTPLAGATWYVTLEPCCHSGKTPPCTKAILATQPARVVIAVRDPFPEVAGGGIQQLQDAGIEVDVGTGEAESRRLLAPYLKRLATGQPWVIAKWAMTLDGRIATATGDSQWISSAAARQRVHELRGCVDAIAVGAGTVAADDPRLTARLGGPRVPVRIVFSRHARLPLEAALTRTAREIPVRLFCGPDPAKASTAALRQAGVDVVPLSSDDPLTMVDEALTHCAAAGMTNLLVEGGGGLLGSFFDADAIDEYFVAVAPKVVGGRQALGPLGGKGIGMLADSPHFAAPLIERVEDDVLIRIRRQPTL